jgi:hypothetical protein
MGEYGYCGVRPGARNDFSMTGMVLSTRYETGSCSFRSVLAMHVVVERDVQLGT